MTTKILWFDNINASDIADVGGKNASLGEMITQLKETGISVPYGFAITTSAYISFLEHNGLSERIASLVEEFKNGSESLQSVGSSIRNLILRSDFPSDISSDIASAYQELSQRYQSQELSVAVRSSATMEDLADASFAGQQETYLNVTGATEVQEACRRCYASLFTDRALSYREEKGMDHLQAELSIGIQKMVRSDIAGSGVIFTLDPESGFPNTAVISAVWGLGETVVQGLETPDEYIVFKPLLEDETLNPIIKKTLSNQQKKMIYGDSGVRATNIVDTTRQERLSYVLNDNEILQLARWACVIEKHYGRPVDIEWAKDGDTNQLFIVQARPETIHSLQREATLKTYSLKERGEVLLTGISVGQAIATGKVRILLDPNDWDSFEEGSILVTEKTDPDWVPIMLKASGVITERGGRTSHAAIVSREFGIPAIVGADQATELLRDGQEVTLSCAEGSEAYIYDGILSYEEEEVSLDDIPDTKTQIMLNVATPSSAFKWWRLPCEGVGLARMEFIINNIIKIHPMALIHFYELEDKDAVWQIHRLTRGYEDKTTYFVDKLAEGIAGIAASQYPHPVIVRMSDFKTNEYAELIGGRIFEPEEENPMLGFRGASRYYSEEYREGFSLECRAIKRVRDEMGLTNVIAMIPFCRTPEEADLVLEVMEQNDLKRGRNGLEIYVMCEIPSNVVLADIFAEKFDGFSIGSNDLAQLVLGVDRDSSNLVGLFDENHIAVKRVITSLITAAHEKGIKVGICGQAPSDYPEFAAFLVEAGIDSISLNPDSVISVKRRVAQAEQSMLHDRAIRK